MILLLGMVACAPLGNGVLPKGDLGFLIGPLGASLWMEIGSGTPEFRVTTVLLSTRALDCDEWARGAEDSLTDPTQAGATLWFSAADGVVDGDYQSGLHASDVLYEDGPDRDFSITYFGAGSTASVGGYGEATLAVDSGKVAWGTASDALGTVDFSALPCGTYAYHGSTLEPAGADADGDGYNDGDDCAPDDPAVNPAATEVCNGIDDDCDGIADPGCWPGDSAGPPRVRGGQVLDLGAGGEPPATPPRPGPPRYLPE